MKVWLSGGSISSLAQVMQVSSLLRSQSGWLLNLLLLKLHKKKKKNVFHTSFGPLSVKWNRAKLVVHSSTGGSLAN